MSDELSVELPDALAALDEFEQAATAYRASDRSPEALRVLCDAALGLARKLQTAHQWAEWDLVGDQPR